MQGERPALLFISASSPTGALIDREEMFKLKIPGAEDRLYFINRSLLLSPRSRAGRVARAAPAAPGRRAAEPGRAPAASCAPSDPLPQGFAPGL